MKAFAHTFADLELDQQLSYARRGASHLARQLAVLHDEELRAPTLLPDWNRQHVIGHAAHNAAALTNLVRWAASGVERPMYASPEQRNRDIESATTLTAIELRNLLHCKASALHAAWAHLPPTAWQATVKTAQGRWIPASETAWLRTREVWVHAVDLDNGAAFGDIPAPILQSLLQDVVASWRRRDVGHGIVLIVDDGALIAVHPDRSGGPSHEVSGSLAALVRWATGRGPIGLHWTGASLPAVPPWL